MAKPRRTTKQSKQTGGTFLGIVLGLIVGLAIAVVVALYITRAPTPFVSKVAPPAASDAGASQPQQYDPNRPLQGKTPGQPVPQAAQPAPPNTAPGATNAQTQSGMLEEPQIVEVPPSNANNGNANGTAIAPKPAPDNGTATAPVKKPGESAPSATAAGSAPKSTSSATTANAKPGSGAAPAPGDANTGYFLQVGAYKTAADAEQQRARLAFQGFESKVTQRDAGGVTYYRVRIGPFSKFEDMNSSRQRLSDAGVDTAVIRFTKQ
ncbi:SPOR domain-containing protein [Paraburkholderia sp. DD10]|jgi:cell division protein FtsN|uniref:Cell division protein FtsN n=1 Tax=Paraburkholderia terricola TaxID=169427 RepID=A0A1M6PX88_9BURK|nr:MULTISPECIES: SPOR domain-containing protein [Paraburkholderia]ORC47763.1 cell division protein [Burkholderia sp. A27]AXE91127.1 cell division protein [Paraburkholderia terricola]MDR6407981.1 cell division protein FtsN [Paraburkholderia terricola]MDR6444604.1 cell division protein FtsN [Paraburkholderia terricola]MDR6479804.1 cell division protein FtsN [Paraburkholderia terricola]